MCLIMSRQYHLPVILVLSTLIIGLAQCEEFVMRQRREHRGHGSGGGAEGVDPHSGDHCVDVSFYGNVTYKPATEICCDTVMEKNCENKRKKVCDTVTSLECDILPYTECDLVMKTEYFASDKMVEAQYDVWSCDEGKKNVTHLKKLPDCKNVTRMNCVQLWETVNGRKVKKNIDCTPVTWEECKLVDVEKNFEVPSVNCYKKDKIPYNQCQRDIRQPFMTTSLECKVKHKIACEARTVEKCATINYRECAEKPKRNCNTKGVSQPYQEYVHQEVCLVGGKTESGGGVSSRHPSRGGGSSHSTRGGNRQRGGVHQGSSNQHSGRGGNGPHSGSSNQGRGSSVAQGFHSFASTNSFSHPARGGSGHRHSQVVTPSTVTPRSRHAPHSGYSAYARSGSRSGSRSGREADKAPTEEDRHPVKDRRPMTGSLEE